MQPETAAAPLIAITSTFTAEPVREPLAFWIKELGWNYEIRFAPYNQVFQQLLDATGVLRANRHGVNVALVRLEDWARVNESGEPDLEGLEHSVGQFISTLESAAACFHSPVLVFICPASPMFLADPDRAAFQQRMEQRVGEAVARLKSVHLAGSTEAGDLYPVAEQHDPHADELGHVPYTPAFFASLGTLVIRRIHALRMAPYKVIVLDCDETLWKGICGEDGPQGIALDPGRRALQEFMLAQHEAGKLLCLVSKNNIEDVLDTFRLNPKMPLHLDHFVSWRINWKPKSVNIAELAEELELGLDSFILVDDNPKECSEMEANQPAVLALALPAEPEKIPAFLRHVWAFDHLRVTEEDRHRSEMYAQQIERGRAEKRAASLEEFLASLELDVRIAPMTVEELPRVAQLTERTNQMNFTAMRRAEMEIQALVDSGEAEVLTVHVGDRFGSYGLTGVIIYRAGADALLVDTFLLSCRVLGRGVEHRMLAALGRAAAQRNLAAVEVPFVRAPRNMPALLFLESVGLEFQKVEADRLCFRFPADYAANMRYNPGPLANARGSESASEPRPSGSGHPSPIPFARIATELRDARKIVARIQAQGYGAASNHGAYAPPRTELERRLAEIWAEALRVSPVGIHDDFFDLGGHSLLAVQLMSRVRQEFGVDLSLELVYSGSFTVAELAEAIEVKEIVGGDRYEALLEEVEALSDEEVRALLAKEGDLPCESS
jgi:FkbH-like protein